MREGRGRRRREGGGEGWLNYDSQPGATQHLSSKRAVRPHQPIHDVHANMRTCTPHLLIHDKTHYK